MAVTPLEADQSLAPIDRNRSFRWTEIAANIAVIISVILMFALYWAQRSDAAEFMRRGTTVNLIALRYTDRILTAEKNVNDYIIKNYDLYRKTNFASEDAPAPVVVLSDKIRADFVLMTDFYSDIILCGEGENPQCEGALIDQWFKDDICQFSNLGEIIGFPQISEAYGEEFLAPVRTFVKKAKCKA